MFISWINHHGRSAALASELGIPANFITGGNGPAPVRYARATVQTILLLRRNPSLRRIVLMLPPFPALLAAAAGGRHVRIAGDLHSGVFNDKKWSWALRPTLAILRRRGIAIVTNESLAQICHRSGVETVVMHDVIEEYVGEVPSVPFELQKNEYVLFPVAYASDEPISEILEAATLLPKTTFVLTGRAPESIRLSSPENVMFTGFVSNDEFEALLRNAGAVAALTTREHTMQRAGYEALSATVPLITSSTAVLREYFSSAGTFTDATPTGIAHAVQSALADREQQVDAMKVLKYRRQEEQSRSLSKLRKWIGR